MAIPGAAAPSLPLAPEAECFLRGAIGDREQHRLLRRAVRIALPRWDHEDVVRAPFEQLIADAGRALALGTDEDGAVGRAIWPAAKALGQHGETGAHRRQHRT